jgi:hypothetical protein
MKIVEMASYNSEVLENFNEDTMDAKKGEFHESVKTLIESYVAASIEAKNILAAHLGTPEMRQNIYTLRELLSFFAGGLAAQKSQLDAALRRENRLRRDIDALKQADLFTITRF